MISKIPDALTNAQFAEAYGISSRLLGLAKTAQINHEGSHYMPPRLPLK